MNYGLSVPPSPIDALQNTSVLSLMQSTSVYEPLYDYQVVTGASNPSTMTFFQNPVGSLFAGTSRTLSDTNMKAAGQLSAQNAFTIYEIQVEILPIADLSANDAASDVVQDIYDFYTNGYLILQCNSTNIIEQGNLLKFAPVNRLNLMSAVGISTTAATTTESANISLLSAEGRSFKMIPATIPNNTQFSVTLGGIPTLTNNARIGVTLNGVKYRPTN